MEQHNITDIEEILIFLNRKKEYYEKILSQTQNLEKAIKSNNFTELNSNIAEKINYTKEIKRLDRQNTKYQKEISANHEYLITDERFYILKKQLQTIITKIINSDKRCKTLLSSSINKAKEKIDKLAKKRTLQHSIKTHNASIPSFVDILS